MPERKRSITDRQAQSGTSGSSESDRSWRAAPTRTRLIEAGLRLFAKRGFDAVSVGDIEKAVGLVPRRGGLYRHFTSKAELLGAAAEEHLASISAARADFGATAASATLDAAEFGRYILAELDRQRLLTHVLERDGVRLPELRDRFRSEVSDGSYRALAEILQAWLAARGADQGEPERPQADVETQAVLLLGSLVNARRSAWTLGAPPLELEDDRLVEGWSLLCEAVLGFS